ncbi:MAG TPA: DUF6600 domain-containing protein [Bryobacteraceae bacterium]|nr:DUF6600 domain-containing protein [Bryobacteraceae bacterium]
MLTLVLVPAALLAGQSRFARLGEFQGEVEVQISAADPWIPAERNLPLIELSWLRTGADGRVEIEMDDGSLWRLGPNSQGELSDYTRLSTGQRLTMLSLDHGTAYYTGQPAAKDVTMLVMPGAQMTVLQGSRIRQTVQGGWSQAAVLEGTVRFSSPNAEMDVREGTTARLEPNNAARFILDPDIAVQPLDRWSEDRDRAQAAPASSAYVGASFGLADLDAAGKWVAAGDLGMVWKPETADGWTPYRNGRWRYYEALGYTWVSGDRWGWMPYHNGRWAQVDKLGWVWQPAATSVFHPAEVYWVHGTGFAGWGPLAPGEDWSAPHPGAVAPQAYSAGFTSFAAFQPDIRTIDGLNFAPPSRDQMKTAFFVPAPPSPAFLTSRLDALRPTLQVGATRVMPAVPGVAFGDAPPPSDVMTTPPADVPPDTSDAGIAPPPDGVYPVPVVAVPVAVVDVVVDPVSGGGHPSYAPRRPASASQGGTTAQSGTPPAATPTAPASGGNKPIRTTGSPSPGTLPEKPVNRPARDPLHEHPAAPPASVPKVDDTLKKKLAAATGRRTCIAWS